MSAPDRITVTPFGAVVEDYADGEYVRAVLVDRLARYAQHGAGCASLMHWLSAERVACDCGLDDLLKRLTSPADSPPPAGETDDRAASRESSPDGQRTTLPAAPSNSSTASPAGGTAAGTPPARESGDGAAPPRDAPSAGGDRA